MTNLFVARYQPGHDFDHNPFAEAGIDPARIELLAIDGTDRETVVLFSADEVTARRIANSGCEVKRASPGNYRDQGSEASVVVHSDGSYTIEETY